MSRADAPDHRADPGHGRKNQVDHNAQREKVEGAEFFIEQRKKHAEHAVRETNNGPANKARSQQLSW